MFLRQCLLAQALLTFPHAVSVDLVGTPLSPFDLTAYSMMRIETNEPLNLKTRPDRSSGNSLGLRLPFFPSYPRLILTSISITTLLAWALLAHNDLCVGISDLLYNIPQKRHLVLRQTGRKPERTVLW